MKELLRQYKSITDKINYYNKLRSDDFNIQVDMSHLETEQVKLFNRIKNVKFRQWLDEELKNLEKA